ncbi:phenylacetic acid degradation protein PaaN [Luteithermobacter gelatinilyticus]|uniref:phenylacetic acid degradation protein PaaN n=1 Tax=Luteithermobacter gelatinilyticus TaxID=2582913 RepID=UPI0011061535|nr:phenylacetic acid degradation protein PaaN [Luteithermobacter gelatinilyticus]
MSDIFRKHQETLNKALEACRKRYNWSPFIDNPSPRLHGEEKIRQGQAAFEAHLGKSFDLEQPGTIGRTGHEISPYTQTPLGIDYPKPDIEVLFKAAGKAQESWQEQSVEERCGVLLEILTKLSEQAFENAHATMHTAGQSFPMGFAGSGSNALDRGLEALAHAYRAMTEIPATAQWEKQFGRQDVRLEKRYLLRPRGVAIVICCATFPAWNAYPAIMANLATANPVIVKPHPNGILPMAIAVKTMRQVLSELGHDPNLVTLAPDLADAPITKELMTHPATKIVDYTGSARFGTWIEQNIRNALVYTETAGVNSVVLESVDNLDATLGSIAQTLCLFSAQMCTSPQNIHIPALGITVAGQKVPYDEVVAKLVEAVEVRARNEKLAPNLFGAIQSENSLRLLEQYERIGRERGRILRQSTPYAHPHFPEARTATPLMIELEVTDRDIYQEEVFAPIAFIIKSETREQALQQATSDARTHGAIASYFYSTDPDFLAKGQMAFANAGASLTCNLTGPMPLNFAAAYSDYHVTGLNPAGNACLTDLAFVANRFRIIQIRYPHVS